MIMVQFVRDTANTGRLFRRSLGTGTRVQSGQTTVQGELSSGASCTMAPDEYQCADFIPLERRCQISRQASCLAQQFAPMFGGERQRGLVRTAMANVGGASFTNLLKAKLLEKMIIAQMKNAALTGRCDSVPVMPAGLNNCSGVDGLNGRALWRSYLPRFHAYCQRMQQSERQAQVNSLHQRWAQQSKRLRCQRNAAIVRAHLCQNLDQAILVTPSMQEFTRSCGQGPEANAITQMDAVPFSPRQLSVLSRQNARLQSQASQTQAVTLDSAHYIAAAGVHCSGGMTVKQANATYQQFVLNVTALRPPQASSEYIREDDLYSLLVAQPAFEAALLSASEAQLTSVVRDHYQHLATTEFAPQVAAVCSPDFNDRQLIRYTPLVNEVMSSGIGPIYNGIPGCLRLADQRRQEFRQGVNSFAMGCVVTSAPVSLFLPPVAWASAACGGIMTLNNAETYLHENDWADLTHSLESNLGAQVISSDDLDRADDIDGLLTQIAIDASTTAVAGLISVARSSPVLLGLLRARIAARLASPSAVAVIAAASDSQAAARVIALEEAALVAQGLSGERAAIVARARIRLDHLLENNVAFNISPTNWDAYPTIGRNGTFVTDLEGLTDLLGPIPASGRLTVTAERASIMERAIGLEPGTLNQGFKIRRVEGVAARAPRSPLEGNRFFLGGGQHLPGGAPEVVVDSIPTIDGNGIETVLTVEVR